MNTTIAWIFVIASIVIIAITGYADNQIRQAQESVKCQ